MVSAQLAVCYSSVTFAQEDLKGKLCCTLLSLLLLALSIIAEAFISQLQAQAGLPLLCAPSVPLLCSSQLLS